jgi:hypothetical protein
MSFVFFSFNLLRKYEKRKKKRRGTIRNWEGRICLLERGFWTM